MNPDQWRALLDKLSEQREEIARLNALLCPVEQPSYGGLPMTKLLHRTIQLLLRAPAPRALEDMADALYGHLHEPRSRQAVGVLIRRLRNLGFEIAKDWDRRYYLTPAEKARIRAMQ